MADWLSSMQQTYEYYIVDPGTWKDTKKLDTVTGATVVRDASVETLGSATFNVTSATPECYIRVYLVTIQNGVTERHPLGTVLVQTPSTSFDGKVRSITMDAYTPLLELKENPPPLGYSLLKGDNVMEKAYMITREHVRAPVVRTEHPLTLHYDFIANTNDNWLTFTSDLIANANHELALDELGRVLFSPKQDTASLQPVWTYTDDNSSILYSDITTDHDIFGIPNVVEVVYSNGSDSYYAKVVNDDPNSPVSTVRRGREIIHRVTEPDLAGDPTQIQIEEYAEQLLRELSTLEYKITYSHGYCPVRLGDCVRFDCPKIGLVNIKAKVIYQSIGCKPGCPVSEQAVYTNKLWG